jgi:hypothetical protein
MTLDRIPGGMKKGRSINARQVGRALNLDARWLEGTALGYRTDSTQ